jgi:transketolase C-terminal domain/subunit
MLDPTHQSILDSSILSITALALEVAGSHHVIDRVTIVRGYAELSVMYPENSNYRDAVVSALNKLSDALEAQGNRAVALTARSLAGNR